MMTWKNIALALLPALAAGQDAIFTVPINLGGNPFEVPFLPGQTPSAATLDFVRARQLDVSEDVIGQIAEVVTDYIRADAALVDLYNANQAPSPKEETAPAAQEAPLFSIPVQISGQQFDFGFYAGDTGNSAIMRFLGQIGVTNEADQNALYPDLMALAEDGIRKYNEEQAAKNVAEAGPEPMFTVSITVGGVAKDVAHYEGQSADAEAQAFCEENGFSVDAIDQLRQCMEVVVGQMQETYAALQQRQLQATEQEAGGAQEAEQVKEQRSVLFTLPVTVGGTERTLNFLSGTTPRESAATFCSENGLAEDPMLDQYLVALEDAIVKRIDELAAESTTTTNVPLFEIPVAIDGADQMLVYYETDTPQSRATAFCDEHWTTIKAGLNSGGKRSDVEIAECVGLISETIASMVQKSSEEPAQERKLILSIPVLVDDQNIPMKLFEGQDPIAVAEAFIAQYNLNPMLVSVLTDAMNEELGKL